MDAFLNFVMSLGGLGAIVVVVIGAAFGWAVADAKKRVVPVEPEPKKENKS